MSVLIKGVEMPRSCRDCPCYDDWFQCGATRNVVCSEDDEDGNVGFNERPEWCPLVEIPSDEIVRCKDCKHGAPNGRYGCVAYHYKKYETHDMKPDDFCSHGERRTDE